MVSDNTPADCPVIPSRRKDDERLQAMLEQAMNAGFDLDTVEGRNDYRSTLEFAKRQKVRCEKASGELTKYGVLAVAGGVVSLLLLGMQQYLMQSMKNGGSP